jgi:hypothetical protein
VLAPASAVVKASPGQGSLQLLLLLGQLHLELSYLCLQLGNLVTEVCGVPLQLAACLLQLLSLLLLPAEALCQGGVGGATELSVAAGFMPAFNYLHKTTEHS